MSSLAESATSSELVEQLKAVDARDLSLAEAQQLMELAVRAYGRLLDDGTGGPALAEFHEVTATDAVRSASALLAAVNLEIFELALWETWGGRPWAARPDSAHPVPNKD